MRLIDADKLKKEIAELHLFEDEQTIRNYYKENYGYSLATDFTEALVEVFDVIDDTPTIKTKQIKYYDEDEQVWKIGEVIVNCSEKPNKSEKPTGSERSSE